MDNSEECMQNVTAFFIITRIILVKKDSMIPHGAHAQIEMKFQFLTDVKTFKVSRETGSAKRVYLPAGRQGGVVKGGEGGQEEVEPEQEHS